MALPNDMSRITDGLAKLEASNPNYTAAYQLRMPRAGRILGAFIQPAAALTADATNNATVTAVSADGLGGAGVVMATLVTDVAGGNWAAGVTKTMTVTSTLANTRFAAGAVISFAIAKGGTGVAVPISNIVIDIEDESIDGYSV